MKDLIIKGTCFELIKEAEKLAYQKGYRAGRKPRYYKLPKDYFRAHNIWKSLPPKEDKEK